MADDRTQQHRQTDSSNPIDVGHVPVLVAETISGLNLCPGSVIIDGTLGGGGHTDAALKASAPDGRVLGLDTDPDAIARIERRFNVEIETRRLTVVQSNFSAMEGIARSLGFTDVDAVMLDLGVSSFQLQETNRGFSFQNRGPLDMRLNPNQNLTAAVIVNEWPEQDLADVLYRYGDERKSRRIARHIVAKRPLLDTVELADAVEHAVGGRRGQRIHPATRTFQALRIAVNEELAALEETLPQCLRLLRTGGRLAVISFHSLEDRIVKRWMQAEAAAFVADPAHPMGGVPKQESLHIVTKKPIVPAEAERVRNPRSRSAKMRIAEKLGKGD